MSLEIFKQGLSKINEPVGLSACLPVCLPACLRVCVHSPVDRGLAYSWWLGTALPFHFVVICHPPPTRKWKTFPGTPASLSLSLSLSFSLSSVSLKHTHTHTHVSFLSLIQAHMSHIYWNSHSQLSCVLTGAYSNTQHGLFIRLK